METTHLPSAVILAFRRADFPLCVKQERKEMQGSSQNAAGWEETRGARTPPENTEHFPPKLLYSGRLQ